jgi:lipoprotein-releasing system ATP-binding protein
MTDTSVILQAQGISRHFEDGSRRVQVLDGVDLSVVAGEMVAIVGASGSGKSTLLHCLGLLDRPDSGELTIAQTKTSDLSERARAKLRNAHLGFVYQFHHLLPEFNAVDNVAMPLIVGKQPLARARDQARAILGEMGLSARLEHYPGQLSGGERQRVALARALVTRPVCVLADEPTGNLDRETAEQVFDLITRIRDDFGTAVILVTHDLQLAARATRCLSMTNGKLTQSGA